MKSKESAIKRTFTGLFVFLMALCVLFMIKAWSEGHFSSMEALREYIVSYGIWGPLILGIIQMLQVILPVLPGWLGCIVGAALFGAGEGFWINYIGISAGSIAAYFLARKFGVDLVRKMFRPEKYEKLVNWVNTKKSYAVLLFLAILLPLAPDDFLCYFSGLTSMSARKFISIVIVAKPWCILVYSIFFAYLI